MRVFTLVVCRDRDEFERRVTHLTESQGYAFIGPASWSFFKGWYITLYKFPDPETSS